MTRTEIVLQIIRCCYETSMANAFRKAAGVQYQQIVLEKRDIEAERKERYYRKMMSGRIGALDRVK